MSKEELMAELLKPIEIVVSTFDAEYKALKARYDRSLAALRTIAEGKWSGSGDTLGAAYSELRAMSLARAAIREAEEGKE
jgi:hypothetical protein